MYVWLPTKLLKGGAFHDINILLRMTVKTKRLQHEISLLQQPSFTPVKVRVIHPSNASVPSK